MSNNKITQTSLNLEAASKPSEFIELTPEHIEACKELHRKIREISVGDNNPEYIYGWNRETFEQVKEYVETRDSNSIPGCSCADCSDEEYDSWEEELDIL